MAREIKPRHYVTVRHCGEDRHAHVVAVHDQDTLDLCVYTKVLNEDGLHVLNAIECGLTAAKRASSKADEETDGRWWDGAGVNDITPPGARK
jgi:hypothetical protein